ncbi:MAG: SusD/RagB family nutrient-binding outer membrane lipoprotein [Bacteroidetes bacterium]|nr:SusD/RagB family nutrient-binding outer membrane lipoprotein [Bacteroidota bacterium]
MKKICIYLVIIIASGSFLSCEKFLDINTNPNAAGEPPINGLLANTTYNTSYNIFRTSDITSYYSQYLASPNANGTADVYDNIDASTTYEGYYNVMTDLYDMKKFAAAKGLNAYIGVADILMALHINMASNLWGDIPYTQAFLGVENLTPVLDKQEALMDTCLSLLDAGVAALQQPDAAGELDKKSDFIHAGATSAWIKTAHALKARMLNQLSKTPKYSETEILNELSKAYTSNNDDAQVSVFEVRNPWCSVAIANEGLNLDGFLSTYFVNAANGNTYGLFDPRLPYITDKTKFDDYRGTDNGKGRIGTGIDHEECYLVSDKWYSSTSSPLQIITYAETKFIEAEANFRKGDTQKAYDAYLAGIAANMSKIGVTAASAYINNPIVSVGKDNLTLGLIMKEKYIACFLSPVTWDDLRRMDYNYKNFTLPVNALLNTFIRRMNYPNNELSRNGKNIPEVSLTDHLWWDK